MKKFTLINIALLIFTLNGISQTNLYGKWKDISSGEKDTVYIIFEKTKICSIIVGADTLSSNKYEYKDIKDCKMTFSLDTMSKPMKLDFIILTANDKEVERLFAIIEYINPNKIRFCGGYYGDKIYPEYFIEEDTIILERL